MPAKRRKRRSAKKKLTEKKRLTHARKALKKTEQVLKAMVEKIEGLKAMDEPMLKKIEDLKAMGYHDDFSPW